MIRYAWFDGFDDVAQKLRLDMLPQIAAFGLNGTCQIADFSNPAIDDAFPAAAKNVGLDIVLCPNTGDFARLNTVYNANTNVVAWFTQDDADTAGVDVTNARIAQLKPFIKPGIKTFLTVGKGADHSKFASLCDMYHVQNYHWREGLKKWSWTAMVEARKQCKGILLHGPSLIKTSPVDFAIKGNNRYFMIDNEYTPLAYNKASVMAALCAGANGIVYYTLFHGYAEWFGKDPEQKFYHCILERPDFVDGYKSFHAELKKYEVYFDTGVRVPFEIANTPIVGATFTLANGDWIRVEVNTEEFNPSYRIIDSKDLTLQQLFKPPVVPSPAKVTVQDGQVNITGTNVKFSV